MIIAILYYVRLFNGKHNDNSYSFARNHLSAYVFFA